MFTLRIVLSGLIAFVPLVQDGQVKNMAVLLVNAQDPRTVPAQTGCDEDGVSPADGCLCGIHKHQAALRVNLQNLLGANAPNRERIIPLNGHDIQIEPEAGSTVPSDLALHKGAIRDPEAPDFGDRCEEGDFKKYCEERNFTWVPKVGLVASQLGRVDSECLVPNPGIEVADRLSARVVLKNGILGVKSVTSNVDKNSGKRRAVKWRFKPALSSAKNQALAEEVIYELEGIKGSVTLKLKQFGFSGSTDIKISPAGEQKVVEIKIVNIDPVLLVEGVESKQHEEHKKDAGIQNFKWFYKISENNIGPYPLPDPVGEPLTGRPYCPQVEFASEPVMP